MVTIAQVRDGVALYIEKELVGKLSGLMKWGFAFASAQAITKMDFNKYLDIGKSMGYVTEDSMVDIEKLYVDFIKIVREQGSVVQHFPMVGDVTFSEKDVDMLKSYIAR